MREKDIKIPFLNACFITQANSRSASKTDTKCKSKITRNPFFNFVRCLRCENPNIRLQTHIVREGGKRWHCMSHDEKKPFIEQARKAPKMKRKQRQKTHNRCSRKKVIPKTRKKC